MKYPILLICSLILLIAGGCDSDPEPGIVLDPKGETAAKLGIDFECSRGEVQIYFKIVGHAKPSAEVMANGDNTGDWINTFFSRTDNGWTLGISANENEGFYERLATVRLSAGATVVSRHTSYEKLHAVCATRHKGALRDISMLGQV